MRRIAHALLGAIPLGCSCSGEPAGVADASSTGGDSALVDVGVDGLMGDSGLDVVSDAGSHPWHAFGCEPIPAIADCVDGWCRIPAGCFVMGSPEDEWGRGAYSENQVKVSLTRSLLIQQHETTQAEWSGLVTKNPSAPPPKPGNAGDCLDPACPVGNVNWFEAAAFANLWSQEDGYTSCYVLEGCTGALGDGMTCASINTTAPTYYMCEGYRLPGEAEWEYAARAGTTTAFYTGAIKQLDHPETCAEDPNLLTAAWYCHNSGTLSHFGGLKLKNPWGLYDMLGNVAEWTNDPMKGLGYGNAPLVDPWGGVEMTSTIEPVVLRGGAPIMLASGCRAASHYSSQRSGRAPGIGFRLVRTLFSADAGLPDGAATLLDAGAPADASAD